MYDFLLASSHDTSSYRGTTAHRDLADTGIITLGITILTEVSQVSHNTSPMSHACPTFNARSPPTYREVRSEYSAKCLYFASRSVAMVKIFTTVDKQTGKSQVGARELFFDWGGVKITRDTFRGVHKSVINDNKNTLVDLVSEYNIIMM